MLRADKWTEMHWHIHPYWAIYACISPFCHSNSVLKDHLLWGTLWHLSVRVRVRLQMEKICVWIFELKIINSQVSMNFLQKVSLLIYRFTNPKSSRASDDYGLGLVFSCLTNNKEEWFYFEAWECFFLPPIRRNTLL